MLLAINKKKLKELSNSNLTLSSTRLINGGNARTSNDCPSKTTHAPCFVEVARKSC